MDTIIGLAIIAFVAIWLYNCGKRTGSRKGFGVGRERGRRMH